jgi:hypothetical protein
LALRKPLPQRLKALSVPQQTADALEGFRLQYTSCQKGVKTNFRSCGAMALRQKLWHHPHDSGEGFCYHEYGS